VSAIHEIGVYDDWFLPSKNELILMHGNLKMNGLGGFSNDYWNSLEYKSGNAWYQYFSNGNQNYRSRDASLRERPALHGLSDERRI
jgi:hypothetical protein